MTFNALQSVALLRMHAKDMTIQSVSVKQVGLEVPIELYRRHTLLTDDKNFLDITLTGPLAADLRTRYQVIIEYEGKLNDELDGFYRSSYVNYRGDTVWDFDFCANNLTVFFL